VRRRKDLHGGGQEHVALGAQVDLSQQAILDQFTQPIMGTNDNIRAFASRSSNFQVVANAAKFLLGHHNLNAIFGFKSVAYFF